RDVRGVAGAARAAVNSGTLSEECKAQLLACAARSTCGPPSAVRCCRTDASGVTHCQTVRRAAACRAPRGGSVCVGTASNGSCAADPCGSLASTPAGVPVSTTTAASTTTHAPTTTTTQGEVIQCCVPSSPMGPIDTCMLLTDSQCSTQEGLNAGPGSCSPNPCVRCCVRSSPGGAFDCIHVSSEMACTDQGGLAAGPGNCSPSPCPTTTAPGATTTTTTGAAPTSTTSTATTRPPTTTTTLLTCSGVFPRCGGSCPVGKHCRPFGRTKSCVCR